jgi:Putative DNA-binding domain
MKPLFDPKAPKALVSLQRWFGSIITQKMINGVEICPTTPTGDSIALEAKKYIIGTDRLAAHTRMELYNQSYWLRLLAALHEEFPFLARLFGEAGFNTYLGIPYLDTYPPTHWSLNFLGKKFVRWIEEQYEANDKNFILMAARLDWSCQEAFFAKAFPPIELAAFAGDNAELIFSKPLVLQPYVHLFSFPAHLLEYREAFLKQSIDFWIEHDFPALCKDKEYFFIVYRAPSLQVEWEELSFEEYELLLHIGKGSSIEAATALLNNQSCIEETLPFWIQKWLFRNWITIHPFPDFDTLT